MYTSCVEEANPADLISAIILLRNSVVIGIVLLREGWDPSPSDP
jgi:hypothetical protein